MYRIEMLSAIAGKFGNVVIVDILDGRVEFFE
jgi:hypothetical protein